MAGHGIMYQIDSKSTITTKKKTHHKIRRTSLSANAAVYETLLSRGKDKTTPCCPIKRMLIIFPSSLAMRGEWRLCIGQIASSTHAFNPHSIERLHDRINRLCHRHHHQQRQTAAKIEREKDKHNTQQSENLFFANISSATNAKVKLITHTDKPTKKKSLQQNNFRALCVRYHGLHLSRDHPNIVQ